MKIAKSQMQRIIKEEYVKIYLEKSGHKVTDARVKFLTEALENGDLDEGIFGNLFKKGNKSEDISKDLSKDIKSLRDSIAKELQSKGVSMSDAPEEAEGAIALSLAKIHPQLADKMRGFVKDQSKIYAHIKDLFPSKAEPRKLGSYGGAAKAASNKMRSAGGPFAVGESVDNVVKKIILEERAKKIILELGYSLTETRIKHLASELAKEESLNEGLLDKFKSIDDRVASFYRDASKKLEKLGFETSDIDKEIVKAFSSLNPSEYDIHLDPSEYEVSDKKELPPPRKQKSDSVSKDDESPKSASLHKAKAPPKRYSKISKEDLENQIKAYVSRNINKKESNVFRDQLAGIWADIENGDISDIDKLDNELNDIKARGDVNLDKGKNLIYQYFSDDPSRFAQVANGTIKIVSERKQRKLRLLKRR